MTPNPSKLLVEQNWAAGICAPQSLPIILRGLWLSCKQLLCWWIIVMRLQPRGPGKRCVAATATSPLSSPICHLYLITANVGNWRRDAMCQCDIWSRCSSYVGYMQRKAHWLDCVTHPAGRRCVFSAAESVEPGSPRLLISLLTSTTGREWLRGQKAKHEPLEVPPPRSVKIGVNSHLCPLRIH